MVMDVSPSPQCVGREFVRQYYTLLNEAPQYLHRFYSNNSSFIHGGNEKPGDEEQSPVIGQTEIHKKIMSLKFNDCHAKIRYVDSQATVGTAVVVQVTGELSNNQEPLRRFMQTFVLAPQTPNKYYVHNDIFRYQDEVFNDSDEEEELDHSQHITPQKPTAAPQQQQHIQQTQPDSVDESSMSQMNNYYQQQAVVTAQPVVVEQPDVSVTPEPTYPNGNTMEEELSPPEPERPATPEAQSEPEPVVTAAPKPEQAQPEEPAPVATEQQQQQQPVEAKAFSWANLLNKNGTAPESAAPVTATVTPQPAATGFPPANTSPTERPHHHKPAPMRGNRPGPTLQTDRGFGDAHKVRPDDGSGGEDKRPERPRYPDNQQVFVGNLPANISEFEVRDFFRSYGIVVEVRINRMSMNKIPFGFVVFDCAETAQKVLAEKEKIEYKGHRLNVEEKKPRGERTHSGSRPGVRRDGQRFNPRGGRGGGFGSGGQSREDSGSRDQGRFNNANKSNMNRR